MFLCIGSQQFNLTAGSGSSETNVKASGSWDRKNQSKLGMISLNASGVKGANFVQVVGRSKKAFRERAQYYEPQKKTNTKDTCLK